VIAIPVFVAEFHSGSGRGIESGTADEPKGTTVRLRGRAVGFVPEKVTLKGPHCWMLENRMAVKAVAEERKKKMERKDRIGGQKAKEKRRNKNASDQEAEVGKNKVGKQTQASGAATSYRDRDRC
jgi:hypothetical protein